MGSPKCGAPGNCPVCPPLSRPCMSLMFLGSRSHIKASMVLTRADNLCIHTYIRSVINNIVRSILMVRVWLEPASYL